ncbi:MAG: hypothetical protein AUK44_09725 [Porphyromonadaceae bacterium CG2_30_38_12]|nr:MAG: hypothetical protein AUK44_09725 [Porphyromonadaceae bacterium CG2_30_38_12]
MNKRNFLATLFSVLFSVGAFAQSKTGNLQIDLQGIEVNADKNQLQLGSGRLLHVIDQKTIAAMPVHNIDELLESVTGVDIRQRSVGGTQADISIRGGSFDQVLVLLNGVNITDPQTGHYNLDIPVELTDIVRIELLQGAAARLYGPNAFSGAVNIVTVRPQNKSVSAQLTAGSFGTYTQHVAGSVGTKALKSFASVSHKTSDGYINNTDYNITNAFSKTDLTTEKLGNFDLQLAYQQKSYGANAFYSFAYPNQFDHTQTFLAALNWNLELGNFSYMAQAYARKHYDRFELFRDMQQAKTWYTTHNYHLTDVTGAKLALTHSCSFVKSTFGLDVRNEHIFSNALGVLLPQAEPNPFDKQHLFTKADNRLLYNAFLDFSKSMNQFNFSLGGASTYNQQFGWMWTGGADITYNATDALRLFASANTANRLPSFTDLYLQNSTQKADPNLKSEQSTNYETGIKYDKNSLKINTTLFYRVGTNVIDWVKFPNSTKFESKNLANVNALGADFSTEYVFSSGFLNKLAIGYTYLSIDKKAVSFDSKYALDYLRHKAVLAVNHKLARNVSALWKLSYNERAGNYTDFASSAITNYKPYVMADVRLAWHITKLTVFADVNNIFDANYQDYGGLTQPGRNVNLGVKLKL